MRKKKVRYNKNYSLSLAMAALLVLANAEAVSAQEEVTSTTDEVVQQVNENKVQEAAVLDVIEFPKKTIYMTEGGKIFIEADVGEEIKVSDLNWSYNGRPLEEAQIWNNETGEFDAGRLINFTQEPTITDGVLRAEVEIGLLFGTSDLEEREYDGGNLRRTFSMYIGDYPLVITNEINDQQITQPIHMFPYEHYLAFDELVEKTDNVVKEAEEKTDRVVKIEKFGESEKGRPQRVGIVAKSDEVINHYLNVTHPKMLKSPDELIELIKSGQFTDPVAVMIHNTHADEKPGPEIVAGLFEQFATKDIIEYTTTDKDGNEINVKYNVSDLLDRLILLFSFVENPDGHYENKREHPSTGLDLNRDHGYQVLPETQNMIALINKWDPVSFFDIHGFMKPMLIEPGTKPHDKNFEADILYPILTDQAYAIGNAVKHNVGYEFMIPAEKWEDGWDDAFSGYTGVYALYQGIFGHTVEFPEMNEKSYLAGISGITAGISHIYLNLDEILSAKLNIFSRGVNKVEDERVNEWLIDKNGNGARSENFFPDYFVIPLSKDQRNVKGAFDMIAYLRRNGIEVNELTEDVAGYKKGDLIVNMAQAKRGFANHVLSMGFDESVYGGMYAELVVNFPVLRGFDAYRILIDEGEEDLFASRLGEVTHTAAPTYAPEEETEFLFVKNNSKDVILAITEAINSGKKVYAGKDGFYIDRETYQTLKDKYTIAVDAVKGNVTGETLQPVKIFTPVPGPNYAGIIYPSNTETVMKELGYQLVDNVEDADLVVMDSDSFNADYLGKKPTIVLGGKSLYRLAGLIDGLEVETTNTWFSHEGLLRVVVNKDNILSSGYGAEDYLYTNEGTWIEKLPEGFEVLITVKDSDDFYVSGWWPGHEAAQGKIMSAIGEYEGMPLFLYAGTPTNKLHTQAFYRWLNNAVFLQDVTEATVTASADQPTPPEKEQDKEQDTEKKDPKVTKASTLPKAGEESTLAAVGLASILGGMGLVAVANDKKRKTAK